MNEELLATHENHSLKRFNLYPALTLIALSYMFALVAITCSKYFVTAN